MPKKNVTEEAALLRTVLDHPEDDAPRLVYADWCQENAQEARAEFIRLQVRLAAMSPADHERLAVEARTVALLKEHRKAWDEACPKWARHRMGYPKYRRGFAESLNLTVNEFIRKAKGIFRKAPITATLLREAESPRVQELAETDHLSRLIEVEFGYGTPLTEHAWASLLGSPNVAQLWSLDTALSVVGTDPAASLAKHAEMPELRRLRIGCYHEGHSLGALANSPRFPKLHELSLTATARKPGWLLPLAGSPLMDRLTSLAVKDGLNPENEGGFFGSPAPPNLTSLSVNGFRHFHGEDLERMTHCPGLAEVKTLTMAGSGLNQPGDLAILARSPSLGSVEMLDVSFIGFGDQGLADLAASESLTSLRLLDLARCEITPEGWAVLADESRLPSLECVVVGGQFMDQSQVARVSAVIGHRAKVWWDRSS